MAGYSVTFSVVDNATKQIDAINRRIAQMRAPMERLSRQVTRFVDVSGLRKVAQGFEWIGKTAGTVLSTLTSIVPQMAAITGAASIAGMTKLVSNYAAWSRELVAAADNIGITTRELQKFEDATRLAGGSAAEMRESLKGLHDNLADLNIGRGNFAETAQALNLLGVNARDTTGHMRSAADLMPEVIKKIAALKDPADRARLATILLGGAGEKLVETFRQSTMGLDGAIDAVKRYKDLTDEQKRSLQLFSEAQGRVGVAFDRLGQQLSATLAQHFAPLLNKFGEFVEKHTPEIIAAVDQISARFAAWLQKPETIKAMTDGVNSLIDSLKWVITHLDTIKTAVEAIAGLFVVKWAGQAVAAVQALTGAIGLAAGVSGATLAAALAGIAAIVGLLALGSAYETPETRAAREKNRKDQDTRSPTNTPTSDYWIDSQGRKHDATTGEIIGASPSRSTGGYLPGGVTPAAYQAGGAAARQPIEFWLDMTRAVSAGFEDAFNHLRDTGGAGAVGAAGGGAPGVVAASYTPADRPALGPSGGGGGVTGGSGGGAGGIDAPAGTPIARTGLATVTSASGRKYQVDARFAQNFQGFINDYEKAGGVLGPDSGTLGERPNNASGHPIGAAIDINQIGRGVRSRRGVSLDPRLEDELAKRWGFVSGNSWRSNDQGHFGIESVEAARRALLNSGGRIAAPAAAAPPLAVPGAKPINGSVDVNITHRNPPPNSAVTASGSGAVNVAPPRVEYQNMASI